MLNNGSRRWVPRFPTRCALTMPAVYPEAVWYTYVDHADLDEIIEEHLVNGRVVERLCI